MFERFTERARRVVVLAQEEARRLGVGHIGTEHLLLALLAEGEGVAALALTGLQVDLEAARGVVGELTGPGEGSPSGHMPFSPRAKKALELSLRESLQLGHDYIGTEHILLGLVREGEGVAAQALERMGADLVVVRNEVLGLLKAGAGGAVEREAPALPPSGHPLCPTCHEPLSGKLGVKVVEAVGDATGERFTVPLLYCRRCGNALGPLFGK